jgi:hypothetical protein
MHSGDILCILYSDILMKTVKLITVVIIAIQLVGCVSIDHIRASNNGVDRRVEVYTAVYRF